MTQWEYKTFVMNQKSNMMNYGDFQDSELIEAGLNELGVEGWELINAIPKTISGNITQVLLIFKRQKNNS